MEKLRWLNPLVVMACLLWHAHSVWFVWGFVGGETGAADFASYYYAAEHALDGGNPYDTAALNALAERVGRGLGAVQPFFYPPPFLLFIAWAPTMELSQAYHVWFWINEVLLFAVMVSIFMWWRRDIGPALPALLALSFSFAPTLFNLSLGQVNLPVMLAVVWALTLSQKEKPIASGCLMGLACMAKMSPALFVAWWMLRGRWKEVAVACGSAVVLSLVALPMVGIEHQVHFYREVLPGFATGDYNGLTVPISSWKNHSLPSLYYHWIPGEGGLSSGARALSSVSSLALLVGLGWCFRRPGDDFARQAQIAAVATATLLIPVFTYEHHLLWAALAVAVAGGALTRGRLSWGWAPLLALAVVTLGANPAWLRIGYDGLRDAELTFLAFLVQESKLFSLLFLGGVSLWLGSASLRESATPESP